MKRQRGQVIPVIDQRSSSAPVYRALIGRQMRARNTASESFFAREAERMCVHVAGLEQFLAFSQCLLCPLALHELTNLTAYRCHHLK